MPPDDVPQSPAEPFVEPLENALDLADAEVVDPPAKFRPKFLHDEPPEVAPTTTAKALLQRSAEALHALFGYAKARLPVPGEAEAEKLSFPWPSHGALVGVDAELESPLQESGDRREHTLAAAPRPYIDVAVVGVAAEGVAAPLQFLVEVVEQDVRQER